MQSGTVCKVYHHGWFKMAQTIARATKMLTIFLAWLVSRIFNLRSFGSLVGISELSTEVIQSVMMRLDKRLLNAHIVIEWIQMEDMVTLWVKC